MKSFTESHCTLETRERRNGEWSNWHPLPGGMYDAARNLAYCHRQIEALNCAIEARMTSFGEMRDVQFRCVATTRTVTSYQFATNGEDSKETFDDSKKLAEQKMFDQLLQPSA